MATPVYWIGQDGNIYYGSGGAGAPVQNLGKPANGPGQTGGGQFLPQANGLYDVFTDSGTPKLTFSATQIADPNVKTPAPTGGSGTPLDTAAVSATQGSIDQLPGILAKALAGENTSFGNVNSAFDASQKQQQGAYDTSSTTNQQNYDATFMDAIRAGIKGLHGLFALLRGTGGGGGTADTQVQNMVGGTTASDIRGGANTRDTNQQALDSSLGSFLSDLKAKRQAAIDTHANNSLAIQHDSHTNLQDLYTKMAGYYSAAGDNATADSFMAKAAALTPTIASESNKQVSKYDATPVAVHAPALTAFAAPTQPSVVTSPDSGQIGSGIFTIGSNNRRRTDPNLRVSAPAGA